MFTLEPNDNFDEEIRRLREKNSGEDVPYQQVPSQQEVDYPIFFFQTQKPYPSQEGTTYYSSNEGLIKRKLLEIWNSYKNQYSGNLRSEPPQSRYPTSWTFYSSLGLYGMPPTVAIIMTTAYEAVERSPVYISGILTSNGYNIYHSKRQL
jgi:hypothetical protein